MYHIMSINLVILIFFFFPLKFVYVRTTFYNSQFYQKLQHPLTFNSDIHLTKQIRTYIRTHERTKLSLFIQYDHFKIN